MARSKTPSHPRFRFKVATAKAGPELEDPVDLPWPVVAIVAGALAAVIGIVPAAALVLVGWSNDAAVPVSAVATFAGQVWLLAQGAPLTIGGLPLSVPPLGISLLQLALVAVAAASAQRPTDDSTGTAVHPVRSVIVTAAQVSLGYLVIALAVVLATGTSPTAALPGSVALAAVGSLVGATARARLLAQSPAWVRAAGRGGAAGLLTLLAVAAVAFATALVVGEGRIATLEQSLGMDGAAEAVWGAIGVAYLPTLLGWAASWLLGAGFTLGDGTLVAPWATRLGLLPSVPVFGALPADGSAGLSAWLVAGAVPGLVAGLVAVKLRRTHVLGALGTGLAAGLLTAVGAAVWMLLSRGALGANRFAIVGPRFPELVIGAAVIVATSAVAAAITWLVDRPRTTSDDAGSPTVRL